MQWEEILKQPRDHRKVLEEIQSLIQRALSDNISHVQNPTERARVQNVRDGNVLGQIKRGLDAYLTKNPLYMDSPADNETRPINR